jgi:PAS domain S-box-containing protein
MSSVPDSGLSVRELGVVFDQLPVGLVFTDREVRTTRTNVAYRRLVGLPDDALIGRRPAEIAPDADVVLAERILAEEVINRGVSVSNVPMERTVAGERRVLSWSAERMMDNGEVVGAVVSVTDVTDRVQADRALRRANARLDLLQRAGCQVGTTLDIFRTARELADLAVPGLADRVAVELREEVLQGEDPPSDPGVLQVRRVAVRDAATRSTVGFAVGDLITVPVASVTGLAAWQGEPFLARNWTEMSTQVQFTSDHAQALLSRGVHTLMLVPLFARGVMLGMAAFCRAENPEPYDEDDLRLVSDLASRAAVHIDNARLYTREHDAAVTFQRSLLPQVTPEVPGLDIAHRYQPASRAAEVGGDWFDVIPLDAGTAALVVGDVTGHSVRAATIMGQLRTTTAALARLGCPPEKIMAQLSRVVVAADGDEVGATCLYAVYDPASQRCRLTTAGHLPPALRHPGGRVEFLDIPGGVMLGAAQGRYPVTDTELPPGSVLALYTDGLIEQPGQDLATGMSRLAQALAAGPARSPDQLCDRILASTGPHTRDDVALLLARTTAQTAAAHVPV